MANFPDCVSPDLNPSGFVDQIGGVTERIAVNDVAVVIPESKIDRRHAHASQIDILTNELSIRLNLCSRQKHSA